MNKRRLALSALGVITQVVLCSPATAKVKRKLGLRALRDGVWEGAFVCRLVLLEANALPVQDQNLEVIAHYGSGRKLRESIEVLVDSGKQPSLITTLWFLRRKVVSEVLKMKGKVMDEVTLSIRQAIEDIGIEKVVNAIDPDRLGATLGADRLREMLRHLEESSGPHSKPGRRTSKRDRS